MRRIIPVILSGGSGTRLWPLSRAQMPKQFLKLMDNHTLLQKTALRTMKILGIGGQDVVTITLRSLKDETTRQLAEICPTLTQHILLEPQARNTAAAVAYALQYIQKIFGEDILLWILPADHFIGNEDALRQAVLSAQDIAQQKHMVTFGIRPTRPETGYGYIRMDNELDSANVYKAGDFIEKPSRDLALKLIRSGEYLWSSGMHLFHAAAGQEHFQAHAPQTWEVVRNALRETNNPRYPSPMTYGTVKEDPFETAIIEKSQKLAVVPCDPQWSDIGCWEGLWEIRDKDEHGNALGGNVLCHETKNSIVLAQDRLVTCVGVENIIVIETGDSILVASKHCNGSLKTLVKILQSMNREETVHYKKPYHNRPPFAPVIKPEPEETIQIAA